LIIKVNNPNVKMVTGRVRIKRSGLIKVFTIPRTKDTRSAVKKLSTDNPGKIYEVM